MKRTPQLYLLILSMVIVIIFCTIFQFSLSQPREEDEINQSQVIDLVWDALDQNTTSHNRLNWQVLKKELVTGESVAEIFEGDPAPGCWSGPKPVENMDIKAIKIYWYVLMTPAPATPRPFHGTSSPTAPPQVPEPFLREAYFLVDPVSGEIVARKLICIIY